MAEKTYNYHKKYLVVQNTTANSYNLVLNYNKNARQGITEEAIKSFPGTALIFENVDSVTMDDADYSNILLQGLSDVKGFFLVLT